MNTHDQFPQASESFKRLNPHLFPLPRVVEESKVQFDPAHYLADVPADAVVVRGCHDGEPMPKQRPRLSQKGHIYTPGSTKDHQRALAAIVKSQIGNVAPDAEWAYGVRVIFYVQTYHRKDVDNLQKTLLDAINEVVFQDDSQVKELMGWSVIDFQRPRTEFVVYRLHKIEREQGVCVRCGKKYRRYQSWKTRLYCSRECMSIAWRNAVVVKCACCGKDCLREPNQIARVKGGKVYCSSHCKSKSNRREVVCESCGKRVGRPQSWFKKEQKHFFCSVACRAKGWKTRVGSAPTTGTT